MQGLTGAWAERWSPRIGKCTQSTKGGTVLGRSDSFHRNCAYYKVTRRTNQRFQGTGCGWGWQKLGRSKDTD